MLTDYNEQVARYNAGGKGRKRRSILKIGGQQAIILTMTAVVCFAMVNLILTWSSPFMEERFANVMLTLMVFPLPQIVITFLLSYVWNRSLYLAGESLEQLQKVKKWYFYPLCCITCEIIISAIVRDLIVPVLPPGAQSVMQHQGLIVVRLYLQAFEVMCALLIYCYHVYVVCRDLKVSFSTESSTLKDPSSDTGPEMGPEATKIIISYNRDSATRKMTPMRGVSVSPMAAGNREIYETGERRRALFRRMMVSTVLSALLYCGTVVLILVAHYNGVAYTRERDFHVRTATGHFPYIETLILLNGLMFLSIVSMFASPRFRNVMIQKEKEKAAQIEARFEAKIAMAAARRQRGNRARGESVEQEIVGQFEQGVKENVAAAIYEQDKVIKGFSPQGIQHFKAGVNLPSVQDAAAKNKIRQRAKTQDYHRN